MASTKDFGIDYPEDLHYLPVDEKYKRIAQQELEALAIDFTKELADANKLMQRRN
jgi:hypothetical protein